MGETQSWLDSWAHTGAGSHVCPHAGREASWGRGVGRNHTGLQVSSLGQKGQEERGGATGKGRVGGRTENSGRGLQRRGWCAGPELPALHTGRSAMAGGGAALRGSPEVAGSSPRRCQPRPASSLIALLTSLGPCHRCLRGGRGGGLQWVWGQPGRWRQREEERSQGPRGRRAILGVADLTRLPLVEECDRCGNFPGRPTWLLEPLGFLEAKNTMDGDQTVVPQGTPQGLR